MRVPHFPASLTPPSALWAGVGLLVFLGAAPRGQSAPDAPPEPAPLPLAEAIQIALDHNRDLRQASFDVNSRAYGISGALAEFAYSVRPAGTAQAGDDRDEYGAGLGVSRKLPWGTRVGMIGGYNESDPSDPDRLHRGSVRLEVTQPLFREFGRLVQLEPVVSAESSHRNARRLLEAQKADVVVAVVAAYEDLLRLERLLESDERFFRRTDQLARLTRAREKRGRASRVDTLRVDLQRGQAETRLNNNQERMHRARQDFAALLGLPPSTEFRLEPTPRMDLDVPDEAKAVTVALANRMDHAQSLEDTVDAGRQVAIARKDLQPRLALVARAEQFGEGSSRSDAAEFGEQTWSVGVAGETDMTRPRERSVLAQQVVAEESARLRLQDTRERVEREVRQELRAYERAQKDLEIATANARLAGQRAELSRRLFAAGKGDHFSVTDAEDAWINSEQLRLGSEAEASLSGYRLLRALGTLIEFPDDLKPNPEETP